MLMAEPKAADADAYSHSLTLQDVEIDHFDSSDIPVPEIVAKQEYDMAVNSKSHTQALIEEASSTLRSVSDLLPPLYKDSVERSSENDSIKKGVEEIAKRVAVSKAAYDAAMASATSTNQDAMRTAAASNEALSAFQKAQIDVKDATAANTAAGVAATKAANDLAAANIAVDNAQAALKTAQQAPPPVFVSPAITAAENNLTTVTNQYYRAQTAALKAMDASKAAGAALNAANDAILKAQLEAKNASDANTAAAAAAARAANDIPFLSGVVFNRQQTVNYQNGLIFGPSIAAWNALAIAKADLAQAQATVAMAKTASDILNAANGAVQKAQADMKTANDANTAAMQDVAKTSTDLAAAKSAVESAQAALKTAQQVPPPVYTNPAVTTANNTLTTVLAQYAQAQAAATKAADIAKKAGDALNAANSVLKSTSDALTTAVAVDNAAIKMTSDAKAKLAEAKMDFDNAMITKALAEAISVDANLKSVTATKKYSDQRIIVDHAQRTVDDLVSQIHIIDAIVQERRDRLVAIWEANAVGTYGLLPPASPMPVEIQSQTPIITPFENDTSVEKHRLYNFVLFNILTFILGVAIILLMLHFME